MRAPVLPGLAALLALALSGCGGGDGTGAGGTSQKATVKAGDTTCELSQRTFTACTFEFEVENAG